MSPAKPAKGGQQSKGGQASRGGQGRPGQGRGPQVQGQVKAPPASKAEGPASVGAPAPPPRLKVRYESELRDRLKQELGCRNVMQVPRLKRRPGGR